MSEQFVDLLKSVHSTKSPIHLISPVNGRGDRYFFVEPMFVFDVWSWKIIGWMRKGNPIIYSNQTLPEWVKMLITTRHWDDLISDKPCTITPAKQHTMFPLCNSSRLVANSMDCWAFLVEHNCWINQDLERCACVMCYPCHIREDTEYSIPQLTEAHCVHCKCTLCICPNSLQEAQPISACGKCLLCSTIFQRCGY